MLDANKRPEITTCDLPLITTGLRIFEKIQFNSWGGMYATVNITLPMFGKVIVSCILSENHVKIYRSDSDASGDGIWNGPLHEVGFLSLDEIRDLPHLVSGVKNILREVATRVLDEGEEK